MINDRRLNKTTIKLEKKYSKQRKINEKKLNKQAKPGNKIISFLTSTVVVILLIFSLIICLSSFMGRINKTPPSFFGYTFMQISTGSMSAETVKIGENAYSSGHKPKDKIVVHSVNTDSLNVGDKIAFYVSNSAFNNAPLENATEVTGVRKTELSVTLPQFFGFASKSIRKESKDVKKLVFHHVAKIYEDDNGVRWFQTIGSSNESLDNWLIRENYIIGIYDDSKSGHVMSDVLYFLTSQIGLVTTILIPLFLMTILIFGDFIKNAYLAKLELDIVEEKRKLTDEICIKNNIGYRMNKKTKYKVLAQAEDDEKTLYLSLLWKDGSAPNALKKYYLKKRIQLYPVKQLLLLNRECEQMYKDGVNIKKIATYYTQNKAKIEEKQLTTNKRLKLILKKYKQGIKENTN